MRPSFVIVMFLLLPFFGGCDKVGGLFGKGGAGKLETTTPEPGGEIAPDLASLVERHPDGVGFRRDLAFPGEIDGRFRIVHRHDNVRVVERSELGVRNSNWNHELETEVSFVKQSGRCRFMLERAGRRVVSDPEQEPKSEAGAPDIEGKALDFVLTEDGWSAVKSGDGDFRRISWAESLGGDISRLLVEAGAYPRTQWFSSSRRWKSGDRVVLTGSSLKMIHPADASGRLELVFEGEEAVGGHPCGVFSVSGNLRVPEEVDFLGEKREAEIDIVEGRIWASLLHPVLMREDYQTIQTLRSGGQSGLGTQVQGAIKVVKSRSWKPRSA